MMKQIGVTVLTGAIAATSFGGIDASAHAKHDLLDPNRVVNIAHRGASGYAPEHTMLAYEMSHKKFKADYIEIDLQMTKDGQLIAMHDETVDRTTNGTGAVKDKTLAEIKRLDAGSWFNTANPDYAKAEYKGLQVPTIDEIFDKYGKHANYYIETKSPEVYPGMEEKLLKTLKDHGLSSDRVKPGQVMIQSFSQASLLKVKALDEGFPLVQLMEAPTVQSITPETLDEIQTYAVGLGPSFKGLTRENTAMIRERGLLLHPYTVNEKVDMERMLDYGVTGVFTNYADRFNEVLHDMKKK
ncbi:glycerophosphodiester phosphodiesterase [Exiguobacterium artemiae]|uniref:glycerophosphodiester phosphodiesterase n=1 Tax=Exiguobacterium artemiae TaxID=340145 RepID=UPI0029645DEF|nr:glycerophosphodiester phosphodiesterase [Exiguobacterium sibiricum]MDW2886076.1 glycerophosphodiester phosphodiesterase [Exiguobacterium sibiricum]